jgi:hypothetical protein
MHNFVNKNFHTILQNILYKIQYSNQLKIIRLKFSHAIHLIKYAYLADMFYACRNQGKTFTGVDWTFYNFGPWSQTVHSRVEPALVAIMANKQSFESDYGDEDWCRWSLRNERQLANKRSSLPAAITLRLDRDIHKYLKDTPSLLDYVYKTPPMIHAAPNECLDLSLVCRQLESKEDSPTLRMESLSNKKQKKFKERILELRQEFQKSKHNKPKIVPPVVEPRHDEVFVEGVKWLESLAGDDFSNEKLIVKFSPDVWNSKTRKGEDVS